MTIGSSLRRTSIYRFPIGITDYQEIEVPVGSIPLSVAVSRDVPNLSIDMWWQCYADDEKKSIGIYVFGTGHPINIPGIEFVGTTVHPSGLVFHTFVGKTREELS